MTGDRREHATTEASLGCQPEGLCHARACSREVAVMSCGVAANHAGPWTRRSQVRILPGQLDIYRIKQIVV